MFYAEIPPPPALAPYIKCFWLLESDEVPADASRERILPDGCMEMVFHFGDRFRQYYQEQKSELQPRSFVFGQIKQFIEIGPTGKTGILAVRFHPHGAQPFLQLPLQEIGGKAHAIQDIFGAAGHELEDQILNAASNQERIILLQRFLLKKLADFGLKNEAVSQSVNTILALQGQVAVEELANQLNVSSRQLERKFTAAVGMSPKMLARLTRFQNVFKLLQNNQINSLTALAYEGGYYDQAHFIKDFKEFSGTNPKLYFSEKHTISEFFTNQS